MEKHEKVYNTLCETICDAKDLEMSSLSPDMLLTQIELDSLDYVELMVLAKREFDVTLTADIFSKNPAMTLGELCQVLVERQQ